MIENIVFCILLLIAVAWSIGCISTSHGRTMVFTTLVLWLVVVFFWTQKDISRLHILWSAPLLVIIENAIEIPIRRKLRDRPFHESK